LHAADALGVLYSPGLASPAELYRARHPAKPSRRLSSVLASVGLVSRRSRARAWQTSKLAELSAVTREPEALGQHAGVDPRVQWNRSVASVDSKSQAGEPASDLASVEAVAFFQRSPTRPPWNRSGHPYRIPTLSRGFAPLIREFGTRRLPRQLPARRSWIRACRPWNRSSHPVAAASSASKPASDLSSLESGSSATEAASDPLSPSLGHGLPKESSPESVDRRTRSRSRNAQPASWSRARRRLEPGSASRRSRVRWPQTRSHRPASRGLTSRPQRSAWPGKPGSSPLPGSETSGLPKQTRARLPTNGNLQSPESVPTPAEADQGSSSDGFEHLSSVQIEASRWILPRSPASRLPQPLPKCRDPRPASWLCVHQLQLLAPPLERVSAMADPKVAGGASTSGRWASKLAWCPSAVDCRRRPPKERMRRSAVPAIASRRSRRRRPQD
jgi:hypothetical protein